MSVSIIEALAGADYNLNNNGAIGIMIAKEQIHNVLALLEKGYDLNEDMDIIMGDNENADDVPFK